MQQEEQEEPGRDEPQLIDLRGYFDIVRRRKWAVILVTAAVIASALAFVYLRTPVYESTATVEVRPLTVGADPIAITYILQSMGTEAARVTSDQIAGAAANTIGVTDVTALKKQISVKVPTGQSTMEITCSDPSAVVAVRCADAFAKAYIADRSDIAYAEFLAAQAAPKKLFTQANAKVQELGDELAAAPPDQQAAIQARLNLAQADLVAAETQLSGIPSASPSPAVKLQLTVPDGPANKNYIMVGILAAIVGLALGIGLAFLRERLDEDLHGVEDLERTIGAPALAVIPKIESWHDKNEPRLVTISEPDSAASEAYRAAHTTLQYLARVDGAKVIAIAGPGKDEGKTTTTGNLAVALARSGKRVIAVSCDLRKPRLHRFFDLDNDHGLSNLLVHSTSQTLQESLFETEVPGLTVMPSGPVPQNPAELLGSLNMDLVLDHLRDRADIVLLDTAPALVVADTLGLAPKADAIVVVVDADNTTREAVRQLRTRLDRVGGRVFACVLNDFQASHARGDDRYGYYSSKYSTKYSAEGYVSTNGSNGAKTHQSRRDRKREAKAKQKAKPEQWR